MRAHIRLARSSPGPVEADWQTDARTLQNAVDGSARTTRSRTREMTSLGESRAAGSVSQSVAEPAATRIRDDRRPRWYEKRARNDAGDRVDRPDERVIWSPFRLPRRRHSRATPASHASTARR